MNTAAQTPKGITQDLRFYLPRWMAAFVVIALAQELMVIPLTGRGPWYIPVLMVIGLVEGAFGGSIFVFLQRWWNPKNSRVVRIRNYVAAGIMVGVGSLWVMTAIYS